LRNLQTISKIKNVRDLYRDISDFNPLNAELNPICHLLALVGAHPIFHVRRIRVKKGYQPRTNTVKDEKGDLVADCHSILSRWKNHFSLLLNIHGVNDVRQTEIHTAEPLVPETSAFEVELAAEELKSHKSPRIDRIPAELIKTGGRTIRYEIHKLIISVWNKEELPEKRKESIMVPIYKKGDKTDCSNYRGISLLPTKYNFFFQHPVVKFNSICRGNYPGSSMWISTQQVNY